jgi:formyl-CoA transferase
MTAEGQPARPPAPGPLADVRVVELGQLLAGPFCGQLLGDLGAEVIKVEEPGRGDPMREWGRTKAAGEPLWWPILGRNKKSITLDVRTTAGQGVFRRLAATADIVIENLRPGTLERWGLGYDVLSALNRGVILVRITGFGQTGPYAHQAGYGSIGEAMGGLRYVTGDPSTPPSRVGISIGDSLAAMFATIGALSALHARERIGTGQVVDCALYEAVLGIMESLVSEYDAAGLIRERTGSILPNVAPSNIYPTADGEHVVVGANQDSVFRRLASAMHQLELADDPRFATHSARGEHQAELDALISAWSRALGAVELIDRLRAEGVPVGRIYRAPEMLADPHFSARGSIVRVPHRTLGDLAMQNVTPRLSATPGSIAWCGPGLGEHNDEVYRGLLGMDDAELQALGAEGVV